jgi:hypothetical protein
MCPPTSVYQHGSRSCECDADRDNRSIPRDPGECLLVEGLRWGRGATEEVGGLGTGRAHRLWKPSCGLENISDLGCDVIRVLLDVVGDATAVTGDILRH